MTAGDIGLEVEGEAPVESQDDLLAKTPEVEAPPESPEARQAAIAEVRQNLASHAAEVSPRMVPTTPERVVPIREGRAEGPGLEKFAKNLNLGAFKGYGTAEGIARDRATGKSDAAIATGLLRNEELSNKTRREKVFKGIGAAGVGAGAIALGVAGIDSLLGGTVAGIGGVQLVVDGFMGLAGLGAGGVALGTVGYVGMKAWHSIKEAAHRSTYKKVFGRIPRTAY